MTDSKHSMEEECQRLLEHLKQLMDDRSLLQGEFTELNGMHKKLIVQLKGDTLAGEGQLHAFQAEKRRMEERLGQLELQIRHKTDRMLELDSKASDYLLKVTTKSNSLYDDGGEGKDFEADPSQMDLIQKLVYEDMMEHNEVAAEEGSEEGSESEGTENVPSVQLKVNDCLVGEEEGEGEDTASLEEEVVVVTPPSKEDMRSLSSLVEELKRVKDEMGQCMTAKEDSFLALEGQLVATKKELAFLRGSMSDMSLELQRKEDVSRERSTSRAPSSLSQEERVDLLRKIDALEALVAEEDRVDLDDLLLLGGDEGDLSPSFPRSGLQSPAPSISGRVAQLERELETAGHRLQESQLRMKVVTKEREHKQRECEMLQKKVTKVEDKMCQLQGTFDALVKAMMTERDELLKDMRAKDDLLKETEKEGERLKEELGRDERPVDPALFVPRQEMDAALKKLEADYCSRLDTCQRSLTDLEKAHYDEVAKLKGDLESANGEHAARVLLLEEQVVESKTRLTEAQTLTQKEAETEGVRVQALEDEVGLLKGKVRELEGELEQKVKQTESLKEEMQDFAPSLREEMDRVKDDASKVLEVKTALETTFCELQEEHKDLQKAHQELKDEAEKGKGEAGGVVEGLKAQLEEEVERVSSLRSSNDALNSRMNLKEQESREELSAREATIQELRLTLTNNQKQSRENLQMLKDDLAALQLRLAQEKEEAQATIAHLKEKILKAEEEAEKVRQELEELRKALEGKEEEEEVPVEGKEEEVPLPTSATSPLQEEAALPSATPSLQEEDAPQRDTTSLQEDTAPPPSVISLENDFEKELSSKVEEIEALQQKVEALEANLKERSSYVSELEAKLSAAEEEKEDLKKAVKEGEEEVELLKKGVKEEGEGEEDYKSRFEKQLKHIRKLNEFIDELKGKVEDLKGESFRLKRTLTQLEEAKEGVEGQRKALSQELEDLKAANHGLEEDLGAKKKLG